MNSAPKRGVGVQNEEGPRRWLPTKALKEFTRDGEKHSAPAPHNQPPAPAVFWQTRAAFGSGNVIYATTNKDDDANLGRLKAAGARAGHTLLQMRKVLRHRGLKHPPLELQEAWLRIGVAQYGAVSASRPRWTFGLHNWVRRYFPEVWRTWPAERIDAFAEEVRWECAWLSAEEKGAMLGIDRETYLALGLCDFWPAGMTLDERKRDQREARNARERASNLASDKVKRPHAQSKAQTKPWEELGISRRTFYRRLKLGQLTKAA